MNSIPNAMNTARRIAFLFVGTAMMEVPTTWFELSLQVNGNREGPDDTDAGYPRLRFIWDASVGCTGAVHNWNSTGRKNT